MSKTSVVLLNFDRIYNTSKIIQLKDLFSFSAHELGKSFYLMNKITLQNDELVLQFTTQKLKT